MEGLNVFDDAFHEPAGGFLAGGFLAGGFLAGGFLAGGFLAGGFLDENYADVASLGPVLVGCVVQVVPREPGELPGAEGSA